MANRYWVGGTGNWNATTTNWSATSGGAGGASVPTSVDDVFFDNLSNATAYTCTLTTSTLCRSLSVAGPASGNVTIAGATGTTVNGNLTIAATGVTWTYSGGMFFGATTTGWTITTNGVSFQGGISFNGAGGGWTLGGAFTSTSGINILQGTFNTGNFNVTLATNFTLTGALARTVNLGSSAISCLTWNALAATNLTVNAGTSTITITSAAGTFNGGGLTYYNLSRSSSPEMAIGDANNTFNAISNTATTFGATYQFTIAGNQTIGTLTVTAGTAVQERISIQTPSNLAGTQITLTVGSFVTNGRIDFRDINWQGAASPLTLLTGGNQGNNTNITLATQKTVYWSLVGGGNWSSTAWALTSGGTPAAANYPLPQDTVIIQDTGLNSGATITLNTYGTFGTLDMSSRTLPMTLAMSNIQMTVYGDLRFSSAVTTTATTANLIFSGYNKTQTIASAGTTLPNTFTLNNLTTTVTLADALTLGTTRTFTLVLGTLNLNAQTLTSGIFASTGALVRSIAFGGGTISVLGATFTVSGTNFTTSGSGTINMTSASSKTFAGGGFSYPTLNQGGAGALSITGANTFLNLTNTVRPATVTLPANTVTTVGTLSLNGSTGSPVTLNSSIAGTRATISKPTAQLGLLNCSVKDILAQGGAKFRASSNYGCTDAGNNSGWDFSDLDTKRDNFFLFFGDSIIPN